jgi:crotonobetainyl-CoA:carnitine CoA-transferase CaiB-like acyl-CoA transferase
VSNDVVSTLWAQGAMQAQALSRLELSGDEPALPSSFAVGTAARASVAVAALAATEIGRHRNGLVQGASVDMRAAAAECSAWFSIDGRVPDPWDKVSGLYRCADGWVRVHANFAHHRDGALQLLGLPPGPDTTRGAVQAALLQRAALEVEEAAARAGLVIAALRSFDEWDLHPQARALAAQPLIAFDRIGDAPPQVLPPLPADAQPLCGVRVLDLTRILAGPIGGRTLAAHGADVMLVNAPRLPNIENIADTSRGKLSCHVDLRTAAGHDALAAMVRGAHVFVQGYRPGGLAELGFGPEHTALLRPGIVHVSLSAYGPAGPWSQRRGFDSLVQTATGFNDAEMRAAGSDKPKSLPVPILDYASGFLIAFATQAALMRQQHEGGSWHVQLSLARTAAWLRSLGHIDNGFGARAPVPEDHAESLASGWGALRAIRHAGRLQHTLARWPQPSVPPGTHAPRWPT